MGDPIPSKWLSEGFYRLVDQAPELALAYDYPNYPGSMTGQGRWVDLYVDRERIAQVGRLWTDDGTGCGIEQLPGGFIAEVYTREVLQLRMFHHFGRPATYAFDDVASRYEHGPISTGDLRAADPNEE